MESIIKNSFNSRKGSVAAPTVESSSHAEYCGAHYIVTLKQECLMAALERDLELEDVEFEIQVRTAAEHIIYDAKRYLAYETSESFLGKEEFQRDAEEIRESLERVQSQLDGLFARSREAYDVLLHQLTGNYPTAETLEDLEELDVSAGALKLYAIYEFVTLQNESPKEGFSGLPSTDRAAEFDRFWLDELVRCLPRTGKIKRIRDVKNIVEAGIVGAVEYQKELAEKYGDKKRSSNAMILPTSCRSVSYLAPTICMNHIQ